MEPHNPSDSPITRIRMADSGKGMGMITSIATVNTQSSTLHRGLTEKLRNDLRRGVGDGILDGSFQVYEYLTTLLHAFHGRSKIVIEENHISGFFGHVRTRNIHGNAEVRALQCWGVVNTITSPTTLH